MFKSSSIASSVTAAWFVAVAITAGCTRDGAGQGQGSTLPSANASASASSAGPGALGTGAGPTTATPNPEPQGSLLRADAWGSAPVPPRPIPETALARYVIDQSIDDVAGTFNAEVLIDYPNTTGAALSEVPLLLHPNSPEELGVPAGEAGSMRILDVKQRSLVAGEPDQVLEHHAERPTLVSVRLPAPLPPTEHLKLVVRYDGKLRHLSSSANDLFSQALGSMGALSGSAEPSDYGLLAEGDGIVTMAVAYPMIAPYDKGAFDTSPPAPFGDVAYSGVVRFEVRSVVPAGVTLVTNLVDGAPSPLGSDKTVFLSAGSFVRDFVLVAGRDLERATAMKGATRVSSIYRARDASAGKLVLDAAVASLDSFERRFGAYPYTELDVAEASLVGGAGGVEFSSMVLIAGMLYRKPEDSNHPLALLMKLWGGLGSGVLDGLGGKEPKSPWDAPAPTGAAPGTSPAGSAQAPAAPASPPDPSALMNDMLAQTLEFTVAHEVAHQYFAGVVGNDSRRFPSLDEPIAQYAAGLEIEDRYGAADAERAMNANVKMNYAMYRLLDGADKPVLRDTGSFASAVEYAGLVYGKAPYLYVELRKKLGDEKLHGAIRAVVDQNRFGLLTTEQWIDALEREAGGPSSGVHAVFTRYLEQAHGDRDLKVDNSGNFVFDAMFPPDMAQAVRQSFSMLGMQPRDLFRMMLGGPLGDEAAKER